MGVDPVGVDPSSLHSHNRYAYANNNPYKFVDPTGNIAETALDVISLGLSIQQYRQELGILNGIGVAYDAIATIVPIMPAGFGIIRNVANGAEAGVDVAKAVDNAADAAKASKQTGSYTIEFMDGMKYHGKGDAARMEQSIKEKSKLNDSGLKNKDHTTATDDREAFKQGAGRIKKDGGVGNDMNYNKINSPGKKYREQDGD